MGEIAEGMIDGTLDYQTGEYLGEGQGFPRTASDNRPSMKENGEVRGVKKFLRMKTNMGETYMHPFCVKYLENTGHEFAETPSWKEVATIIQKDFDSFVSYVKNYP